MARKGKAMDRGCFWCRAMAREGKAMASGCFGGWKRKSLLPNPLKGAAFALEIIPSSGVIGNLCMPILNSDKLYTVTLVR
jgi:hypothetical protein